MYGYPVEVHDHSVSEEEINLVLFGWFLFCSYCNNYIFQCEHDHGSLSILIMKLFLIPLYNLTFYVENVFNKCIKHLKNFLGT